MLHMCCMQVLGDDDDADGRASDWEEEMGEAPTAKQRAQRCSGGRRRINISRRRRDKANAAAAEAAMNVRAFSLPLLIN
jgi:hypothetical protein